ncbi:MAG: cation-translocating P-type ATPase [Acholeplasma sp.]|nr:cation-translocating P-type ATPase [Acholeplasma sp.]
MKDKNYQLDVKTLEEKLSSNLKQGLTQNEVDLRLKRDGFNRLNEGKRRSMFMRFIDQLNDFMVFVLLGAAVISVILAIVNNEPSEIFEGVLILAIVLVNAFLGIIQEGKAEKALESIKKMSSPHATVLRDGVEKVVSVEEIVAGDIVLLNAGDIIPADLRIVESYNLKIDESALTGEPVPVEKISDTLDESDELPLGDQANLAFMSTVVTYGRGKGLVLCTAMNTEIGKIAGMIETAVNEATPLQQNINKLGKTLALVALGIVGGIFVIDIIQALLNSGKLTLDTILESFMTAIALAVAAIPEGLPAIITIVLALGMRNLANRNAIMKSLPSVETLGSTSVICSDKTGTLTQNVMTITAVYSDKQFVEIKDGNDYKKVDKIIDFGVLCNDTKVNLIDGKYELIGDPTEKALIDLALNTDNDPIKIIKNNKRIHEFSFDSERKLMTTINEIDGKYYAITKGAPDIIFNLVTNVEGGKDTIQDYAKVNLDMADMALRVLAISYKEIDKNTVFSKLNMKDVEKDLTLLGLVGMIDPSRPEVKDAIHVCDKAGIKTVMITGDHKNTAIAIAKDLNIINSKDDVALTGLELDALSDEEFFNMVEHVRVYARVSPENKVRIVKAWKSKGVIVAMTGDGVNDAPALKNADIGIAMGITGTEVAKGAADMILTDDNFGTIVSAVSEGRGIFDNIRKAINFLLSCNVGEIITILLGTLIGSIVFSAVVSDSGNVHILSAVQILWVNLVTDSLMAIALGLDPKNPDIMDKKPRKKEDGLFQNGLWRRILWQGLIIGLLAFGAYYIGYQLADPSYYNVTDFSGFNNIDAYVKAHTGQTMAFMVLAFSQLFHAFNVRSEKISIFKLKVNKYLVGAFIITFSLQLLTVLPGVRNIFDIFFIKQWYLWLIIIGLSIAPVVIVEVVKLIGNIKNKK